MKDGSIDLETRRDAVGLVGAGMRRGATGPVLAARAAAAHDLATLGRRLADGSAESRAQAAEHATALLRAYNEIVGALEAHRRALMGWTITDLGRHSLSRADGSLPRGPDGSIPLDPGDIIGPMPGDPDPPERLQ